jgi:hypothetical protein
VLLTFIQLNIPAITQTAMDGDIPPFVNGRLRVRALGLAAPCGAQFRLQISCAAQTLRNLYDTSAAGNIIAVGDASSGGTVASVVAANKAAAALFKLVGFVGPEWEGGCPLRGVSTFVTFWSEQLFANAQLRNDFAHLLKWTTCVSCPAQPEVNDIGVDGNVIRMGVPGRTESDTQSVSRHGYAAPLPPASGNNGYDVQIQADLFTWDAYSQRTDAQTGYWDVFAVVVGLRPYWEIVQSDPIAFQNQYVWPHPITDTAIVKYNDGKESASGARQVTRSFTTSATSNYLSVVLDTATAPESDNLYPSRGTITVDHVLPKQAINTRTRIVQ